MVHAVGRGAAAALAISLLLLAGSRSSAALESTKAGSGVFESNCSDCHSVVAGKNKTGPSLFGVVGRRSAAIDGFAYSDAMRAANLDWTPETLDAFITSPRTVVPKTRMTFPGLSSAHDRADLLAYLAAQR